MPEDSGQDPNNPGGQDPTVDPNASADPNAGQDPAGGSGDGKKTYDEEYVRKLRQEAAGHRTELKKVQDALKKLQDAQLTEEQRKEQALKDAETRAAAAEKKARVAEIKVEAANAGAAHPDVVAKLVDDDATDVKAAIDQVKKNYPELFKKVTNPGKIDGGAGGDPTAASMNDMIRKAAGRR